MVGCVIRRGPLAVAGLFAACLLAASGCGPSPVHKVEAVGSVTLDGKPLEDGTLLFLPDDTKGNTVRVSCYAKIKNGSYKLATAGVEDRDSGSGAPPGWYKVVLNNEDDPRFKPKVVIPNKYYDEKRTPLAIEIVESPPPGHYDLKLTSK